jgi:hypothetical protein
VLAQSNAQLYAQSNAQVKPATVFFLAFS